MVCILITNIRNVFHALVFGTATLWYSIYSNNIPLRLPFLCLAGEDRCGATSACRMCQAIKAATVYWNAHRRPCVWGRRHRTRRQAGIAMLPKVV